jgi:hypothetical protein
LKQGIGGRTHLRVGGIGPVTERQESDALHRKQISGAARPGA